MKKYLTLFLLINTFFEIALGGFIWLLMYKLQYGTIGFNGPAGLTMVGALLSGWLVSCIVNYVIAAKMSQKISIISSLVIAAAGTAGVFVMALILGNYAARHFPDVDKDNCRISICQGNA